MCIVFSTQSIFAQHYLFSKVSPSGQTLYYDTLYGDAMIVSPLGSELYGDYYYGYTKPSGNLTIPSSVTYHGITYSVKYIEERAFYQCTGLTSVTIPSSITTIYWNAFYGCSGLTSFYIPSTLTTIVGGFLNNCNNITSIVVSSDNPVYDSRNNCNAVINTASNTLVQGCNNTVIPNDVVSIGFGAFSGLSSLTSITIPSSVKKIDVRAFENCNGLVSLTIPSSVKSIGSMAFWNCTGLTSISIPDSVTMIGGRAFWGCSGLDSIYIGKSVDTICYLAFEDCSSLTSVLYNADSCTTAGYCFPGAYFYPRTPFYNCSNITNFIIGDSVKAIPSELCDVILPNLTTITIPSSVVYFGGLFSGYQNITVNYSGTLAQWCNIDFYGTFPPYSLMINGNLLTHLVIPDSITSIGRMNFAYCSSLESVTIPNSVTKISEWAFDYCTGLTSVSIGESVDSIEYAAFSGCISLSTIIIPDAVVSIGISAFGGCSSLETVVIGESVNAIGQSAFYNCTSLDTVYLKPTIAPTIGTNCFERYFYTPVFILNGCFFDNYWNEPSWHDYMSYVNEPYVDIDFEVASNNEEWGDAFVNWLSHNNVNAIRCDSTIVISATAFENYHFDHWSNGRTANPDTLFLEGDSIVTAIFERNVYSLSANTNDSSLGSVVYPNGNSAFYLDTVMAVAQPTAHYHAVSWDNVTRVSITKDTAWVLMTGDITISCNFVIDTYTVSVVSSDIMRGTVSGGGEFEYTMPCTISATSYSDYYFHSWSNGSTANPYTFAVSEDITLTALFLAPGEETYTVTVQSSDPSMGSANVNGRSSLTVMNGEVVTLTAVPFDGFHFVQWSDGMTQNPRTFNVTQDTMLVAFFEPDIVNYTIVVVSDDEQMGSVEGGGIFVNGDTVTISATPQSGYYFHQWNDGDTSNPRAIIVSSDSTFIAYFNSLERIDDVLLSQITVFQQNGQIVIDGLQKEDDITVFDITGRTMAAKEQSGNLLKITVPISGVYIIKVGMSKTIKMVVIK